LSRGQFVAGGGGAALLRSASGILLINIASTLLILLGSLVLARLLTVPEYGIYAFVVAFGLVLAVPAILGIDVLLVREVAVFEGRQSWGSLKGLIRLASAAVLCMSIALSLAVMVVSYAVVGEQRSLLLSLWIGLIALPLVAIGRVNQAALMGLSQVVSAQVPESLLRPALFLGLVIVTAGALDSGLDATWAVALHVASAALGTLATILLLRRAIPRAVHGVRAEYQPRTWLIGSFQLALMSGAAIINAQTGVLILGALRGPEETGLYAVATRGAIFIAFGLYAVNTALRPAIARLWAEGRILELQRVVTLSSRAVFLFSLPISVAFIIAGTPIIEFLFGSQYTDAGSALAILSIGQLANAAFGSAGTLLTMTGHQKQAAAGIGAGALVNVALCWLLVPVWGLQGAAVAATVSVILWNVLLAWVAHRKLGIDSTALGGFSARV
jgi:O-antigen/teichoic acid export membrane protein